MQKNWIWYGEQGHFIGECKFHLFTQIGKYLVSTVGNYYYKGAKQTLKPGGIYFESQVWINGNEEIEDVGYKTAEEANQAHIQLCLKYDKMGE